MKCSMANMLMMKYMDGDIQQAEAKSLNEHLAQCPGCKDEFFVYDSLLTEFAEEPQILAPEGFEFRVMAQVSALNPNFIITNNNKYENIVGLIWGVFSVLFGIGTMLSVYREQLLNYMLQSKYFGGLVQNILPATELISEYASNLRVYFGNLMAIVSDYFYSARGVILIIAVILVGVQIYVYPRNSDKVEA